MSVLKIKFSDGTVQTIQGDIVEVKHKEIPTDKEWTLKTVDTEGQSESIDFIGGRPDDR